MPAILRHTSDVLWADSRRPARDLSEPVHSGQYRSGGYRRGLYPPDRYLPDRSSPYRYCPDCGRDRSFEQHHGAAGCCPDTADRYCPEWYCLTCGAALLLGALPVAAGLAGPTQIRDRVA